MSKCIDICRASEKTDERIKTINQEEVAAVGRTQTKANRKKEKNNPMRDCWYCGQEHEARKECCPAWGKKCSKCNAMNHFAVKCKKQLQKQRYKTKKPKDVHTVGYETDTSDSENGEVFTMEQVQSVDAKKYSRKLFAKMLLGDKPLKCQLDCGATVNILSDTDYMEVCDDPWLTGLRKCDITLKM